jgi:hypothetical protein
MTFRRLSLFALALLAVLAAAYGAYWFHVAGEVRKGLDDWAARIRAGGGQARWDQASGFGFPFRVGLRLTAPLLSMPPGQWQAEALTLEAAPFDLTRVTLTATGRHRIATARGETELTAGHLSAVVRLTARGILENAVIRTERLEMAGLALERGTLSIDPLPVGADAGHQTPTLTLGLSLQGLDLPKTLPLLLGPRVETAELAATVKGGLPPGPLPKAIRAWAADGGVLDVSKLALDWQQVSVDGDGTLALDPAGQPLAALALRVRGLPLLMDRLAESGMVEAGAANALKFVLMMMSKPDSQGRPAIAVPVSVQESQIYLGPAPLTRFPALVWPEE